MIQFNQCVSHSVSFSVNCPTLRLRCVAHCINSLEWITCERTRQFDSAICNVELLFPHCSWSVREFTELSIIFNVKPSLVFDTWELLLIEPHAQNMKHYILNPQLPFVRTGICKIVVGLDGMCLYLNMLISSMYIVQCSWIQPIDSFTFFNFLCKCRSHPLENFVTNNAIPINWSHYLFQNLYIYW